MMIDTRTVQRFLQAKGLYRGEIDGGFGKGSIAAGRALLASLPARSSTYEPAWDEARVRFAVEQTILESIGQDLGAIDGKNGPRTQIALERWQDAVSFDPPKIAKPTHQPTVFPRQRDARAFYGAPGTGHTRISPPYQVRYAGKPVGSIVIHEKCAESALRIMERVKAEYGEARIRELELDDFGGCYNNRPMRNGSTPSMHAYAAAWDWDANRNQLRWTAAQAQMAKPDYRGFIDAHYAEGWISLGRERNFDWMHFQAARF